MHDTKRGITDNHSRVNPDKASVPNQIPHTPLSIPSPQSVKSNHAHQPQSHECSSVSPRMYGGDNTISLTPPDHLPPLQQPPSLQPTPHTFFSAPSQMYTFHNRKELLCLCIGLILSAACSFLILLYLTSLVSLFYNILHLKSITWNLTISVIYAASIAISFMVGVMLLSLSAEKVMYRVREQYLLANLRQDQTYHDLRDPDVIIQRIYTLFQQFQFAFDHRAFFLACSCSTLLFSVLYAIYLGWHLSILAISCIVIYSGLLYVAVRVQNDPTRNPKTKFSILNYAQNAALHLSLLWSPSQTVYPFDVGYFLRSHTLTHDLVNQAIQDGNTTMEDRELIYAEQAACASPNLTVPTPWSTNSPRTCSAQQQPQSASQSCQDTVHDGLSLDISTSCSESDDIPIVYNEQAVSTSGLTKQRISMVSLANSTTPRQHSSRPERGHSVDSTGSSPCSTQLPSTPAASIQAPIVQTPTGFQHGYAGPPSSPTHSPLPPHHSASPGELSAVCRSYPEPSEHLESTDHPEPEEILSLPQHYLATLLTNKHEDVVNSWRDGIFSDWSAILAMMSIGGIILLGVRLIEWDKDEFNALRGSKYDFETILSMVVLYTVSIHAIHVMLQGIPALRDALKVSYTIQQVIERRTEIDGLLIHSKQHVSANELSGFLVLDRISFSYRIPIDPEFERAHREIEYHDDQFLLAQSDHATHARIKHTTMLNFLTACRAQQYVIDRKRYKWSRYHLQRCKVDPMYKEYYDWYFTRSPGDECPKHLTPPHHTQSDLLQWGLTKLERNFLPPSEVELDYAYGAPVLEDCYLLIQPGKITSIYGLQGSGKTTVLNLIARLYDVQSGSVNIGLFNQPDYRNSGGVNRQPPIDLASDSGTSDKGSSTHDQDDADRVSSDEHGDFYIHIDLDHVNNDEDMMASQELVPSLSGYDFHQIAMNNYASHGSTPTSRYYQPKQPEAGLPSSTTLSTPSIGVDLADHPPSHVEALLTPASSSSAYRNNVSPSASKLAASNYHRHDTFSRTVSWSTAKQLYTPISKHHSKPKTPSPSLQSTPHGYNVLAPPSLSPLSSANSHVPAFPGQIQHSTPQPPPQPPCSSAIPEINTMQTHQNDYTNYLYKFVMNDPKYNNWETQQNAPQYSTRNPPANQHSYNNTFVPLVDLNLWMWLKHIAYVTSAPSMFVGTIRDNIRLGNPFTSDEDVELCASKACVHQFITHLEHGYDTVIGAGGLQLPLSIARRIGLARALVRKPKILLLDETLTCDISPEDYDVNYDPKGTRYVQTQETLLEQFALNSPNRHLSIPISLSNYDSTTNQHSLVKTVQPVLGSSMVNNIYTDDDINHIDTIVPTRDGKESQTQQPSGASPHLQGSGDDIRSPQSPARDQSHDTDSIDNYNLSGHRCIRTFQNRQTQRTLLDTIRQIVKDDPSCAVVLTTSSYALARACDNFHILQDRKIHWIIPIPKPTPAVNLSPQMQKDGQLPPQQMPRRAHNESPDPNSEKAGLLSQYLQQEYHLTPSMAEYYVLLKTVHPNVCFETSQFTIPDYTPDHVPNVYDIADNDSQTLPSNTRQRSTAMTPTGHPPPRTPSRPICKVEFLRKGRGIYRHPHLPQVVVIHLDGMNPYLIPLCALDESQTIVHSMLYQYQKKLRIRQTNQMTADDHLVKRPYVYGFDNAHSRYYQFNIPHLFSQINYVTTKHVPEPLAQYRRFHLALYFLSALFALYSLQRRLQTLRHHVPSRKRWAGKLLAASKTGICLQPPTIHVSPCDYQKSGSSNQDNTQGGHQQRQLISLRSIPQYSSSLLYDQDFIHSHVAQDFPFDFTPRYLQAYVRDGAYHHHLSLVQLMKTHDQRNYLNMVQRQRRLLHEYNNARDLTVKHSKHHEYMALQHQIDQYHPTRHQQQKRYRTLKLSRDIYHKQRGDVYTRIRDEYITNLMVLRQQAMSDSTLPSTLMQSGRQLLLPSQQQRFGTPGSAPSTSHASHTADVKYLAYHHYYLGPKESKTRIPPRLFPSASPVSSSPVDSAMKLDDPQLSLALNHHQANLPIESNPALSPIGSFAAKPSVPGDPPQPPSEVGSLQTSLFNPFLTKNQHFLGAPFAFLAICIRLFRFLISLQMWTTGILVFLLLFIGICYFIILFAVTWSMAYFITHLFTDAVTTASVGATIPMELLQILGYTVLDPSTGALRFDIDDNYFYHPSTSFYHAVFFLSTIPVLWILTILSNAISGILASHLLFYLRYYIFTVISHGYYDDSPHLLDLSIIRQRTQLYFALFTSSSFLSQTQPVEAEPGKPSYSNSTILPFLHQRFQSTQTQTNPLEYRRDQLIPGETASASTILPFLVEQSHFLPIHRPTVNRGYPAPSRFSSVFSRIFSRSRNGDHQCGYVHPDPLLIYQQHLQHNYSPLFLNIYDHRAIQKHHHLHFEHIRQTTKLTPIWYHVTFIRSFLKQQVECPTASTGKDLVSRLWESMPKFLDSRGEVRVINDTVLAPYYDDFLRKYSSQQTIGDPNHDKESDAPSSVRLQLAQFPILHSNNPPLYAASNSPSHQDVSSIVAKSLKSEHKPNMLDSSFHLSTSARQAYRALCTNHPHQRMLLSYHPLTLQLCQYLLIYPYLSKVVFQNHLLSSLQFCVVILLSLVYTIVMQYPLALTMLGIFVAVVVFIYLCFDQLTFVMPQISSTLLLYTRPLITEALHGIQSLKLFSAELMVMNRYVMLAKQLHHRAVKLLLLSSIYSSASLLVFILSPVVVLVIAYVVFDNHITSTLSSHASLIASSLGGVAPAIQEQILDLFRLCLVHEKLPIVAHVILMLLIACILMASVCRSVLLLITYSPMFQSIFRYTDMGTFLLSSRKAQQEVRRYQL